MFHDLGYDTQVRLTALNLALEHARDSHLSSESVVKTAGVFEAYLRNDIAADSV